MFPCGDRLIKEVSLRFTAGRDVKSEVILHQRFDPPVRQNEAMVSTALDESIPGRAVVDGGLLKRFNEDRQLVETVDSDFYFSIDAFDTEGNEISGSGNLGNRFEIPVGNASIVDYGIFKQADMKCADGQLAWPEK